ncbi:uncharacterized protein LY79DRAFT_244478 [Colletotrichum navitas]|uniref:Uncharacterized protein n=1 Tax=Colletotrichum navitas TaxID=681940 RepID=A0AAD8PWW7_9PEZI|nr:uncharacterized protein LY79DRAFT_244478 [Colletotrichum navitas]KAK1586017.1 hypothetical protein LY79DRAFT_244478 [Colletotrichum navitas]
MPITTTATTTTTPRLAKNTYSEGNQLLVLLSTPYCGRIASHPSPSTRAPDSCRGPQRHRCRRQKRSGPVGKHASPLASTSIPAPLPFVDFGPPFWRGLCKSRVCLSRPSSRLNRRHSRYEMSCCVRRRVRSSVYRVCGVDRGIAGSPFASKCLCSLSTYDISVRWMSLRCPPLSSATTGRPVGSKERTAKDQRMTKTCSSS